MRKSHCEYYKAKKFLGEIFAKIWWLLVKVFHLLAGTNSHTSHNNMDLCLSNYLRVKSCESLFQ